MDKHSRIGTVLALTLSIASAALAAYAFAPTPVAPLSDDSAEIDRTTSVARPVTATPTEVAPVVFAKSATVAKAALVKARKRICDRRGNTHSVGYAIPTETRISNDTGATVCWTE